MTQRLEAQGNKTLAGRWDDGSDHGDVAKIIARADSRGICYIRSDYIKNGQPKYGSFHHHKTVPGFTVTFEIDHIKGEQLECVEGYYESKSGVIQGLQFRTNLRISELIGSAEGCTKFSLAVDGKKIIGFHGSTDPTLSSLGAYFTWITPTRLEAKGGKGGKVWSDGTDHEGVTKIYVGGFEGIQYIKFDYVKDGQHIYGPAHGVRGRGFTQTFEINHIENEYLVSVEGYYDDGESGAIQGIKFETNIRTSELMGNDEGRKFLLAANGRKIIGFHGYAEKNLNSLGAYFMTPSTTFTKFEYKGSHTNGDLWDDGTHEGIRKVCFHTERGVVRCITTEYENRGKIEIMQNGLISGKEEEFLVEYPNEFITSVEVTCNTTEITEWAISSTTWVTSLTFKTSKGRTSPTFGIVGTIKSVFESKGCALVGFHGRGGNNVCAIGAYFRTMPCPANAEKLEAKGGDGGASWDDGSFDGIRNIYIGHGEMGITFIKFLYDNEKHVLVGDDHGNKKLLGADEFKLEYSGEYLISVEGSYDVVEGSESEVITMLRFKTNLRTSEVFGINTNPKFVLEKKHHKIVGFHGKASNMLHQIGVHVLPI